MAEHKTLLGSITFDWPTERPHFATVVRVVDGDTIRCDIDMDLKEWKADFPVRLDGCNSWDILRSYDGFTAEQIAVSKEAKAAATANLTERLPVGTQVVLTTIKDYKYGGEFVAKVWLLDGTNLVDQLIEQQWLAPWDGRGKGSDHVPPWPRTVQTAGEDVATNE